MAIFPALIVFSSILHSSSAIINGTIAVRFQYPFVVSLQWDHSHKCGGVLLDSNTILTVAHCYPLIWVNPRQPDRVTALLGTRNQNAAGKSPSRRVGIRRIVWPDNFPERLKSEEIMKIPLTQLLNDYILLKTNRSISRSLSINYASLGSDRPGKKPPSIDDRCVVMGWGRYKVPDSKKWNAEDFPQYLRQGLMEIVNDSYCWYWGEGGQLSKPLACARQVVEGGFPKGTPCFGDSGSPLVCREDGMEYLAGLVKGGILPCNYRDEGATFVRVSNFRRWIERNIDKRI